MSELKQKVAAMIDKFVGEIGLTHEQTFNPKTNAWYWKKGSAGIEVFIQDVPVGDCTREFLRVFSPLMKVPEGKECDFFRKLLEINDTHLGLKMSVQPETNQVFATFERDIIGIDFNELKTCILDLEWWADEMDDHLISEFGGNK